MKSIRHLIICAGILSVHISLYAGQYSFLSGTSYVVAPDSPSLDSTTNALTVECWYNRLSFPNDWNAMVSKSDPSFNLTSYFLGSYANTVRPIMDTSPIGINGETPFGNVNPSFPDWHHFAMQYDRTNYSIYVDGSRIYLTNFPAQIILGSNPLTIGCQSSGVRPFTGYLTEVRVSKCVRYTGSFNPLIRFTTDSNTVALYHFDEGTGTVVHDSSGNGNDGVLQGTPTWSTNMPAISPITLQIHRAVFVAFSGLSVGTNYQLQLSTNAIEGDWMNYGTPFTATDPIMTLTNYWNVDDANQIFFRLLQP